MHYENGDCLIGCCGSLVDWMSHTYDLMTQNFNWTFSVVLKYPYNFFLLAQLTVQSDFTVIHNVSYNLCFSLCRLLNTFIHFHFNFLCSYLYLNIKLFLKFDWFTWLSSIFYITLQIIYIYNYFHLRRTFFFGGGVCACYWNWQTVKTFYKTEFSYCVCLASSLLHLTAFVWIGPVLLCSLQKLKKHIPLKHIEQNFLMHKDWHIHFHIVLPFVFFSFLFSLLSSRHYWTKTP